MSRAEVSRMLVRDNSDPQMQQRSSSETSGSPRFDSRQFPDHTNPHTRSNRAMRVLWQVVWLLAFRPSPKSLHGWRRFLLRLFGAQIGAGAHPYPSVRIWAPWNLQMGPHSCLGPEVDCYCVDRVVIGAWATVSQYSFLCAATHDYRDPTMPLVTAPIAVGERAWVAADAFIGPGVTIGKGAVVGARASVFRDVEPWTVVGGNPARIIKKISAQGEGM
jgi:putative colanic acid biosynthesis acetyltransferase WcaF